LAAGLLGDGASEAQLVSCSLIVAEICRVSSDIRKASGDASLLWQRPLSYSKSFWTQYKLYIVCSLCENFST